MAEVIKMEDFQDKINPKTIIEFLEYEEAMTKDPETANRIKTFLKLMGIWS
jgi:hypothetical protein